VVTDISILLLMGTGWTECGPRHTFDFTVPLLVLTAMGATRWSRGVLWAAVLASVVQFLAGAAYLGASII
jgi:hypothetical protein